MSEPTEVRGQYFDGRRATAHPVVLTIANDRVIMIGDAVHRDEPLGSVMFSERIGRTPRFVRFSDDAFCEIADVDGLQSLLSQEGTGQDRLSRWEQSRHLVAILVVSLLALGIGAYRYGLPFLAKSAADRLPTSAVLALSTQVLSTLDSSVFEASRLPEGRQMALARRFASLRLPASTLPMRLTFRSSAALGANALALPSGFIVVTDGLVHLSESDDEIMAVLAHEAGHVQERHGLRNVIQSSVMSILVTWYIGDISGLVAAAPTALIESKYSRDFEREADAYAARTLAANGLPAGLLADILERMEAAHGDSGRLAAALTYLSSHPTTAERLEQLRRHDGGR